MNCIELWTLWDQNTSKYGHSVHFLTLGSRRNLRMSEFSPSRKKLKSSKNPWHHLSTLGPSIHLSTSYIVSKFEENPPTRSRDIGVFVLTENWQIQPFFGWLILHVVGRPHSRIGRRLLFAWIGYLGTHEIAPTFRTAFPVNPATCSQSSQHKQDPWRSRHLPTALDSQGYIMNCINL